jgi:hypothetical protein
MRAQGALLAMIVDDPDTAKKIADLVRRLSSPHDGEVIATVHALRRTLEANGLDIHAIADPLVAANGKHIPEEKLQQVWDAACAWTIQQMENRQHGVDDFIGTDGKPTWEAVALFLQRNKSRLNPRVHEFIDKMAAQTVWGEEPTERQHKFLHSLFFQLGGKIT